MHNAGSGPSAMKNSAVNTPGVAQSPNARRRGTNAIVTGNACKKKRPRHRLDGGGLTRLLGASDHLSEGR